MENKQKRIVESLGNNKKSELYTSFTCCVKQAWKNQTSLPSQWFGAVYA